ncbi:hypothetical protein [Burkholderia alba]|uniref:hypothetical protein n=1 Tax=Burkholderia alba TaxID=2683677 RepID=UPI002B052B1B|nr:hypothetical protein [Burkholderia alba]
MRSRATRSRRRAFGGRLVLALAVLLGWLPAGAHADDTALGRALFTGAAPLRGRLSTHPSDLPAGVVRCANCHAAGQDARVANSIAPRLNASWLGELQSRRGGPPSQYDRASFCALLRTGLDPAYVLINVEMPRYRISDRDCGALWQFLDGASHG